SANLAFSRANCEVAHWKTREQLLVFQDALSEYQPPPRAVGYATGSEVGRAELENHIIRCLLAHIASERIAREQFRTAPLSHRLHVWLGIAVVVSAFSALPGALLIGILGFFFHEDFLGEIRGPATLAFLALWVLYIFASLLHCAFGK